MIESLDFTQKEKDIQIDSAQGVINQKDGDIKNRDETIA